MHWKGSEGTQHFTGRTDISPVLLSVHSNPVVGTGFESFWLGRRLAYVWTYPIVQGLTEAHNGYLEYYLNLGFVGELMLFILLWTGYRNIIRLMQRDKEAGQRRLGYFVIGVVYNLTEAGFRSTDLIWIAFLIAIISVPSKVRGALRASKPRIDQFGEPEYAFAIPTKGSWSQYPPKANRPELGMDAHLEQRTMKIAYLILAHNNPEVLARMISQLSATDSRFFVHIDKRATWGFFTKSANANVQFCDDRIAVYWGDFSQVEAILVLMRSALANEEWEPDYCVLISGCDYPLRSGAYISRFLSANQGLEFMNLVQVPAPGKPLSRIDTIVFPHRKPVRRLLFRCLAKLGFASRDHRQYLRGLRPYSGSEWWALSRTLADTC